MKIAVRNTDNVVIKADEDLCFVSNCLYEFNTPVLGCDNTNTTIYENVTLPSDFACGAYSYDGSTFTVCDQAKLDFIAAEEADEQARLTEENIETVRSRQKELIEKYGWRATRYSTQKDLLLEGIISSTDDTQNCYIQICKWLQAVRDIDEVVMSHENKMASLDSYESWFPYTTQAEYNADALGERTP